MMQGVTNYEISDRTSCHRRRPDVAPPFTLSICDIFEEVSCCAADSLKFCNQTLPRPGRNVDIASVEFFIHSMLDGKGVPSGRNQRSIRKDPFCIDDVHDNLLCRPFLLSVSVVTFFLRQLF